MALGVLLALGHRRNRMTLWPVIVVVVVAALATGMTAHLGGRIAFGEPDAQVES
jgi:hypothetical protein